MGKLLAATSTPRQGAKRTRQGTGKVRTPSATQHSASTFFFLLPPMAQFTERCLTPLFLDHTAFQKWQYVDSLIVALTQFVRLLHMGQIGQISFINEALFMLQHLKHLQLLHIKEETFPAVTQQHLPVAPWEPSERDWLAAQLRMMVSITNID